MLRVAGPVVIAEVGWMAMQIVDVAMVGRLGPEAIGAVGVGSALFLAVSVFGMGLLLGLDTVVSHAFGSRSPDECRRWLHHGTWLAVTLTLPMTVLARSVIGYLDRWGFDPVVLALIEPYLGILVWSMLPLLLYATFRRYLQAMSVVAPVMFALISANVINAVTNWILVFGNLGAPALGVEGAAWATCISRVFMVTVLAGAIVLHDRRVAGGLLTHAARIEAARMRRLLTLGWPAAVQTTLEFGVFAAVTALAGRLEPATLAAHQIVLNLAGLTFMVPLGLSSAAAARVGQAVGRRDAVGARSAGWTAIAIGSGFMAAAAAIFILLPRPVLAIFTDDVGVITTGVTLLFVAAIFQLFDGLQGVATGVLRGLGDTRTPMLFNLAGHWLIGLPVGYVLCFQRGWGVVGLWVGLSVGLVLIGIVLVATWYRQSSALAGRVEFVSSTA